MQDAVKLEKPAERWQAPQFPLTVFVISFCASLVGWLLGSTPWIQVIVIAAATAVVLAVLWVVIPWRLAVVDHRAASTRLDAVPAETAPVYDTTAARQVTASDVAAAFADAHAAVDAAVGTADAEQVYRRDMARLAVGIAGCPPTGSVTSPGSWWEAGCGRCSGSPRPGCIS